MGFAHARPIMLSIALVISNVVIAHRNVIARRRVLVMLSLHNTWMNRFDLELSLYRRIDI